MKIIQSHFLALKMYKILFALILIISQTQYLFSQEEFSLVSEDHVWNIRTYSNECSGNGGSYYKDVQCENISDTLINSQYIIQFDFNGNQLEAIEKDNKTYVKRVGIDTNFVLLYDFNLAVGDTFFTEYIRLNSWNNAIDTLLLIVESIDSVDMFDGTKRKRFNFFEADYRYDPLMLCGSGSIYWIDGIGNPVYPIYSLMACFEDEVSVDCYSHKEVKIFFDCVFNDLDIEEDSYLKVYPNPVRENLYIASDESINEIYLTNLYGQTLPINQIEQGKYDTSNMESGIYILSIIYDENRVETRKIIVSK